MKKNTEALAALEQARSAEIPLPAVLFTQPRRIALVRSKFYQKRLRPFLIEGA